MHAMRDRTTREAPITTTLLLAAIVIVACVLLNGAGARLGLPSLLLFIALGMLAGVDGPLHLALDDYALVGDVCSAALVFIMFYGGFGTSWAEARPMAGRAALLSTAGVALASGLVGLFCHLALGMGWLEGLLMGAVVGSTDAASVFSVLRSRRLALREGTASLLELESGSNDPMAYLLTMVLASAFVAAPTPGGMVVTVALQVGVGVACGVAVALVTRWALGRHVPPEGLASALMVGVALLSYALPQALGGNGYLSCYLAGIILGNGRLPEKERLVHFFDGANELAQVGIFFLLGLLATPSRMLPHAPTALAVAAFLILVARPLATFALLAPTGSSVRQMALVSFAGLRGAASIVFSIMAMTTGAGVGEEVFHVTFFVVLVSILVQGTALPAVARRLGMVDEDGDVMRTFTDYVEERDVRFVESVVPEGHPWVGLTLGQIELPPGTLVVTGVRDGQRLVPDGDLTVLAGDALVLVAHGPETACPGCEPPDANLCELELRHGDSAAGRALAELPRWHDLGGGLVVMVLRGEGALIPNGSTVLEEGDVLVVSRSS